MIPVDDLPVLTAAEMRAAEAAHGDLAALMARAGEGVAEQVRRLAAGAEALVLCGPGNNGGDGYVAAAALARAGHPVRVAAAGEPGTDLARAARARWAGPVEAPAHAGPAPVLVDALFGTGLSRPLEDGTAGALRRLAEAARLRVAVDLPSGLDTDTGAVPSEPPRFDLTLALGFPKRSHLLQPAARWCGTVRVLDIGVPAESGVRALSRPALPRPGPDSHKFSRGMVAVVGGPMRGASLLACEAAMRSGAGYVALLGGEGGGPHALVHRPADDGAFGDPRVGAMLVGPGLGRDARARDLLARALATEHPLVIDGDALHLLDLGRLAARRRPAVLTPHEGEFRRLFGGGGGGGGKVERALDAARRAGAVVAYKGPDTVVAAPDGRVAMATQASPWLSTAGTGDVLAGATAAQVAAGLDPFDAACAGVWLHADAARRCGAAFVADDLARQLTAARASS